MRRLIFFPILILVLSCQPATSPHQAELGEEFQIKLGQQVIIPDENIIIKFKDVLEDSRCPEGVACFWAGNAKIAILLNRDQADLNTYLDPKQAITADYTIQLIAVNPYPVYNVDIQKKEYVAKLLVTKN